MKISGRLSTALIAAALLLASCTSSGGGWNVPTQGQSATQTPGSEQTLLPPSAPTNVEPNDEQGYGVHCEGDEELSCWLDLRWQNTSGPGTRFRVYMGMSGEEEGATCSSAVSRARLLDETQAGETSVHLASEGVPIGDGFPCYWVSAVNDAGESNLAPSSLNWEGD
jgi:hypothetical protein